MAFKSGEDIVTDASFSDVLKVLEGGTSPWQRYLNTNLKYIQNNISSYSFKVYPKDDFKTQYKKLSGDDPEPHTAGLTDKKTGAIILNEYPEKQLTSGGQTPPGLSQSYLLAAVHECVHLVSAPVKPGADHSTALKSLDSGFLEGLVELIAEDLLTSQTPKIALPSGEMLGHQKRKLFADELVKDVGIDVLADLLFGGHWTDFDKLMQSTYGINDNKQGPKMYAYAWDKLKIYATLNMTDKVPIMPQSMANAKKNAAAAH